MVFSMNMQLPPPLQAVSLFTFKTETSFTTFNILPKCKTAYRKNMVVTGSFLLIMWKILNKTVLWGAVIRGQSPLTGVYSCFFGWWIVLSKVQTPDQGAQGPTLPTLSLTLHHSISHPQLVRSCLQACFFCLEYPSPPHSWGSLLVFLQLWAWRPCPQEVSVLSDCPGCPCHALLCLPFPQRVSSTIHSVISWPVSPPLDQWLPKGRYWVCLVHCCLSSKL